MASSDRQKAYQKQWNKENPEKLREYGKRGYWKYRDKRLAKNAAWYKSPKGLAWRKMKDRRCWLKNKYGITVDQYNDMLASQAYKCAICFRKHGDTTYTKLGVDHNHKTKQVRALLCKECNLMIGYAKEIPNVLRKAAKYVEKYNA